MRFLDRRQLVGKIIHGYLCLSLVIKSHQSLTHKVYVFSDYVWCLGKIFENTQSNDAWETRLGWFKSSPVYKTLTESTVSHWFSSGMFTRFNTLQLMKKSKIYC